jgi:hypothetical protein
LAVGSRPSPLSLRNRLVAAYVFIAVVPVLLLLAMAGLAAYLPYWQLGRT